MKAEVKNGILYIEIDIETPRTSGTGGSKLFAQGSSKLDLSEEMGVDPILDGKKATVQVNAYVPIKQFAA